MKCAHRYAFDRSARCPAENAPGSMYCIQHNNFSDTSIDNPGLDARFGTARYCRKCQERFRSLDSHQAYCVGCRKTG